MSSLSVEIQKLLEIYSHWFNYQKTLQTKKEPKITAQKGIEIFAFIYERIRNIIEYKGENLLRKYAIERILKRQLWLNPQPNTQKIAESLIQELIWARYLKDQEVPIKVVQEIEDTLNTYLPLINIPNTGVKNWPSWIQNLMAAEIENIISFNPIPLYYVEIIKDWFLKNYELKGIFLDEKEKEIQVFIAVCRGFLKIDQPTLHWYLLKKYYPSAITSPKEIIQVKKKIESLLSWDKSLDLFRIIRPLITRFIILKEIIEKHFPPSREVLLNEEKLKEEIEEVCDEKYVQIQNKVRRGIIRSTLYIFITKVLLALLLEIPYEKFFFKKVNILPIEINALFPPLLMLFLGSRIKTPGEENTLKLTQEVISLVSPQEMSQKQIIDLTGKKTHSKFRNLFFFSLYGLLFLLIFGFITVLLIKLKFNLLGLIIFFLFLSLVLLFGFRVQYNAMEIFVTEKNEGFVSNLIDNLFLPFLNLGAWLTKYLAKINFLIILMDFLIEAPLKSIIEIVGEWFDFIRKRKEEIVEVPI